MQASAICARRLQSVVTHTCAAHQCTTNINLCTRIPDHVKWLRPSTGYGADCAKTSRPVWTRDTPPCMAGRISPYMLTSAPVPILCWAMATGPPSTTLCKFHTMTRIPQVLYWYAEMNEQELPALASACPEKGTRMLLSPRLRGLRKCPLRPIAELHTRHHRWRRDLA